METESLSILSALAHSGRLRIFRLVMRRYPQPVAAGEIAAALGMPPSTASPHLGQLRAAGLVTQSRVGTSLLYRGVPDTIGDLTAFLLQDCCGGRPATCLPQPHIRKKLPMAVESYSVLFICTGNSARSIMSEVLLRDLAGDRFTVYSAGTKPKSEMNPFTLELLQAKGHDISELRAKNVREFQSAGAPKLDFVFTVCDRAANEECPAWQGQPITGHWGQPDPVKATGTDAERRLAFQQVYGALRNRISSFAALPIETLDRASLQKRVDDLADADKRIEQP